jgi:hypothetical protein
MLNILFKLMTFQKFLNYIFKVIMDSVFFPPIFNFFLKIGKDINFDDWKSNISWNWWNSFLKTYLNVFGSNVFLTLKIMKILKLWVFNITYSFYVVKNVYMHNIHDKGWRCSWK